MAETKDEMQETQWERERRDRLQAASDYLSRRGYRFCDIPVCNCGSWHSPENDNLRDEINRGLDRIEVLTARLAAVEAERDTILQQARAWAGEAKTQRATVNEVGAALGGMADWQGIAAAVREWLAKTDEARRLIAMMRLYCSDPTLNAHAERLLAALPGGENPPATGKEGRTP